MSALPPIATAKADISKPSCLLYRQKRTCAVRQLMSALGQKWTHAPQQKRLLFDHFVSAGEYGRRHSEAERLGCFEIDHQFVLSWRLHWHIAGLLTLEDAIDVAGRLPVLIEEVGSIRGQTLAGSECALGIDCGQLVPCRKRDDQ